MPVEARSEWSDERAQTAIDFVIGMGVLLLAIAFVLAFVPSMFAPFFGAGIGDPITVDRSVSYLAEDRFAETNGSTVIDPEATDEFFQECANASDEVAWLGDELGITDRSVQLHLDGEYCGGTPEGSVTVGERLVRIDGEYHRLSVKVW